MVGGIRLGLSAFYQQKVREELRIPENSVRKHKSGRVSMDRNRPRGREKHVTGGNGGLYRRGQGLGSGPVGSGGSHGFNGGGNSGSGGPNRSSGGRGFNPLFLIIILVTVLGGGGGALGGLLGGGSSSESSQYAGNLGNYGTQYSSQANGGGDFQSFFGGDGDTSTGWSSSNTGAAGLNTSVAAGSRDKYTVLKGGNQDRITIMVYMCGTDLESRSGMATADLQEMAAADLGDHINLIVYTGGCTRWQNSAISRDVNQIYQVKDGKLVRLVDNVGSKPMTSPETLTEFILWSAKNFPANRNELIFWDHGGGSVTGYGYDEKHQGSGSMSLSGINRALKAGGVKFDFIGFDACLMATMENALMLNSYADYMIASEETEPGIGWYYTNWLTELGKQPSLPTLTVGQRITDDFVNACAKRCPGQQTTLSVVDLAEISHTAPEKLTAFSKSISSKISGKKYTEVSLARNQTREFAKTSRIDQVDLVDLSERMKTDEGKALSDVLKQAVKYNRTSSNMTNAYGISIYFPYQRMSYVDTAVQTYNSIGMDESYSKTIQEFASLEASGQVAAGGSSAASPLGSLLGGNYSISSSGNYSSADALSQLLGSFLDGNTGSLGNLSSAGFLSGRSFDADQMADYIKDHHLDADQLTWTQDDGEYLLKLDEDQWDLITGLDLNAFYDDGQGYIDLGLDNVYGFDDAGNLVADTDGTWLAIDGQTVAYYHLDTEDDGTNYTITGRVPCLLNDTAANLILVFDNDHPSGYIAGAQFDYKDGETDVQAKNLTELKAGDVIDFTADYFDYDGNYQDSYRIGDPFTVQGAMEDIEISNAKIGEGKERLTYRITDVYNQQYWTEAIEQ